MRTLLKGWLALLAAVLVLGCEPEPKPAAPAQSSSPSPVMTNSVTAAEPPAFSGQPLTNLVRLKIWVGAKEVDAELALKPVEVATGMMHRKSIGPEDAMLFAFGTPQPVAFYNRNVHFDLGVAYCDPEGVIQEIVTLKAQDATPVPSRARNVQFVLEVAPDWFQRNGVGVGTMIRTPRGPLRDAFVRN